MDLIAERATALGGQALGTVRLAADNSQLAEFPPEVTESLPTVEALAERYAALAASTRKAIEAADGLCTFLAGCTFIRGAAQKMEE